MYRVIRKTRLAKLLDAEAAGELDAAEAEQWQQLRDEEAKRADAAEDTVERLLRNLAEEVAAAIAAKTGARSDMEAVAAALLSAPDASTAVQAAARRLLRHTDAAGLSALATDPRPDPVEEAKVWVALRRSPGRGDRILSVHPSEEGARTAVERDGACPKGWQGLTRLDHPLEERWSSFSGWQIRGVPVEGRWPDTCTVALIVNGVAPLSAYADQFDAYEALDNAAYEARQAGSTCLTAVEVHRVIQPQPTGGGS